MSAPLSYQRSVSVAWEGDVLVVGGGPAGIAAAIAAGRAGARTALVERYGFLGGNATASLVGPFMTSYSADGKTQIIRGVFDELVRRMEEFGGAIHPSKIETASTYGSFYVYAHQNITPFDPEALKVTAAEMALEAGVKLYLHTSFVDPILEGSALAGAFVHSKSGLQALCARVTVDCSADGDVSARAGVPMTKGRASDGKTQPMTMFFRITNVDGEKIRRYRDEHGEEGRLFQDLIAEARRRGDFPIPKDWVNIYEMPQGGIWRVNTSRITGLDGTDVEDLTRAEIEGRKQVFALMKFFRAYCPGLENATLIDTAAQIGVRETRRIVGEYVLTAEDLLSGRHFDDVAAFSSYPIDIHAPDGSGGGFDWAKERGMETASAYEIPYRSLVPLERENLLVAGRCLSATHEAAAAVRVMPPCFAMGHAAGVAAAIAAERGIEPRHINRRELQQELLRQHAYLGVGSLDELDILAASMNVTGAPAQRFPGP